MSELNEMPLGEVIDIMDWSIKSVKCLQETQSHTNATIYIHDKPLHLAPLYCV